MPKFVVELTDWLDKSTVEATVSEDEYHLDRSWTTDKHKGTELVVSFTGVKGNGKSVAPVFFTLESGLLVLSYFDLQEDGIKEIILGEQNGQGT